MSAHPESLAFYVWMARACALIAFAGFTPTYWVPVAAGLFYAPPAVHLHGLLFFAWTVFFLWQATSAAAGRLERHRLSGLVGIALATAMVFAGVMASVTSIEAGIARGQGDNARAFAIVPITMVLSFGALVAAAIANVRRPEIHMRLMLVAAITILPPAIARGLFALFAPEGATLGSAIPVAVSLVPNGLADLLLLLAIGYDWRVRGRPHRAYVIAVGLVVAVQVVRVPLAGTAEWHAVTEWLRHFVGSAPA